MLHQEPVTRSLPALLPRWRGVLLSLLAWLSLPAAAGNFAVSPIRIDFDHNVRNGAITVTNDAQSELKLQIRLVEWLQDWDGKDGYRESDELIYFPRIATLAPGEKRVVRVGLRGAPAQPQERSYRLFIEDIPEKTTQQGSRLAIAVRFGVPLFVRPAKETIDGEIEALRLDQGKLYVRVRNIGNVHFRIASVNAFQDGQSLGEAAGWYLLPGAARDHLIEIPAGQCHAPGRLDVTVTSDRVTLQGSLEVTRAMCGG